MGQDIRFIKSSYLLLHEGLKLLLNKINLQIIQATQLGINHLKLDEMQMTVSWMIKQAEETHLNTKMPIVFMHGMSEYSLSLLKTGAVENIKYLNQQKNKLKEKGLRQGIDAKIKDIENILNGEVFKNVELDEELIEEEAQVQETQAIKPIVFISYAAEELALADFIRDVLLRWVDGHADIFVARRDIPSGDDPLKIMLNDKLRNAKAIIPICSIKSKTSSWVWWESAAVWGNRNKVYPLFTNINPGQFGAPLTLVTQGKDYFDEVEFLETLTNVCKDLMVNLKNPNLSLKEKEDLNKLKTEYSKPETSAKIYVGYTKLSMTPDLHKYSFLMDVENITQMRFDDLVVELLFPQKYLENKDFTSYPSLRSSALSDDREYFNIVFSYSSLHPNAKSQFGSGLLPGKKLRVFGEKGGMMNLVYVMDHDRYDGMAKFNIQWKVYINGGAPIEGMIPLREIQMF